MHFHTGVISFGSIRPAFSSMESASKSPIFAFYTIFSQHTQPVKKCKFSIQNPLILAKNPLNLAKNHPFAFLGQGPFTCPDPCGSVFPWRTPLPPRILRKGSLFLNGAIPGQSRTWVYAQGLDHMGSPMSLSRPHTGSAWAFIWDTHAWAMAGIRRMP